MKRYLQSSTTKTMDSDFMVNLVNNYIQFYKAQILDINLFDGLNENDLASTNIQLNVLYSEMKKYQTLDENSKDVVIMTPNNESKKFTIYKNDNPFCTTDHLFVALIEITNMKEESTEFKYEIRIKK